MATRKVAPQKSGERLATMKEIADMDFGIVIPREKIASMEEAAQSYGVDRRLALAILSTSRADILSRDDGSPLDFWVDQCEQMSAYISHLDSQLEFAKMARIRMLSIAAAMEGARRSAI